MQLPSDPLRIAALLKRSLTNWRNEGNGFAIGLIPESWDFEETLKQLAQHNVDVLDKNEKRRQIEVSLPTNYFASLSALISAPARRIEAPSSFYLEDMDYLHDGSSGEIPDGVAAYLDFVSLFAALRASADHESSFGSQIVLVFLHKQKVEITCNYSTEQLRRLPDIAEIQTGLRDSEPHSGQRLTMIKEALLSRFPGRKKIDLGEIASDIEGLIEEVKRSYQLYVSEFSFQRIQAQIEREKVEFTARINKTFSDIQNQLLALPVALILVGGQMKQDSSWTLPNIIVWAGALTFSCLMSALLRNQKNTLAAIFMEFSQQWKILQKDHSKVSALFNDAYRQIEARHSHQLTALDAIDAAIALALGFSTSLLIFYSTPEDIAFASVLTAGLAGIFLYAWHFFSKKCQARTSTQRTTRLSSNCED